MPARGAGRGHGGDDGSYEEYALFLLEGWQRLLGIPSGVPRHYQGSGISRHREWTEDRVSKRGLLIVWRDRKERFAVVSTSGHSSGDTGLGEKSESATLALISFPLVILVAFALTKTGLPEGIITPVSFSAGVALAGTWIRRRERAKARLDRVAEVEVGAIRSNPRTIMIFMAFMIVLLEGIVSIILGGIAVMSIAGTAAVLRARFSPELVLEVSNLIETKVILVALPLFFVAGLPLGKYAAHRLRKPMRWFFGAVILALLMGLGVDAVSFWAREVPFELGPRLVAHGLTSLTILLSFWLGHRWARKTQDAFLMGRLFQKVSGEDRAAVLDLLRQS
jgi:hypothetical protein